PNLPTYWFERGECWTALGQNDKAAADRAKGKALQPPAAPPPTTPEQQAQSAAITHLNAGRAQESIAEFSRAIQIKPDYAPAFRERGRAYLNLTPPQPDKTVADETKAIELNPKDEWSWYHRAAAYKALKRYDTAI